ncbi:hypothetical protein QFC20_006674 [Naganishia adeliensis]|uniref:Uncharacterized protein n=1 Tax=Naganishia adeliensis TaxID=92952 RepID=A0ACC2V7Y2_9TREE|nr:hypothetical protein QFC20_006674 [Naganishia adeliensis]
MKFSFAISAIAVAFIGAVSAAPAPGTYANCKSNDLYKKLNLGSGYAVITSYDNNAANVDGQQPASNIADCIAQCSASAHGYCYPKNNL